jgi:hypothetical protein
MRKASALGGQCSFQERADSGSGTVADVPGAGDADRGDPASRQECSQRRRDVRGSRAAWCRVAQAGREGSQPGP